MNGGMGWESKPSSVLDGHLSRPQRDRPRRHLRGGSRLPASASNLLAADSEIAAGRIALFTPAVARRFGLCCSRAACRVPIWTVDARSPARLPGFHQAPVLCAARTFLWRRNASDHPCPPHASVVNVQRLRLGCRGVRVSGYQAQTFVPTPCYPATQSPSKSAVPKGRFELPRGYPHYALNVARLPVPPLRLVLRPPSTGPEPTSGLEPATCSL
jgi:hypothetical protein